MRTMMKKCGVYATFAVVLLVMAALVTGCSTGGGDYQPPAGMGAVRLNLADTTRTIRSIVPGTSLSDFVTFDVDFQATGSGGVSDSTNTGISKGSESGPYDLAPGKYDIEVVGYTADGDAAAGTVKDVIVVANSITNTATIELYSYDPEDGTATDTGTFKYTISNNITVNTLTSATMTFDKIGGGGPTTVNLLATGWNGNITLTPGYYYVDFVLVANSGTRTFRHILHIYKNQISSFDYTFTDEYFTYAKITLTVNFNPNEDPKPELEKSSAPSVIMDDGETVILSIEGVGANPKTIDITVTNEGDYSSIEWYVSSNGTTALTTGVSGTNDEILTINVANAPFNVQGLFQLTVVGTTTTTSVPTSSYILISVVP